MQSRGDTKKSIEDAEKNASSRQRRSPSPTVKRTVSGVVHVYEDYIRRDDNNKSPEPASQAHILRPLLTPCVAPQPKLPIKNPAAAPNSPPFHKPMEAQAEDKFHKMEFNRPLKWRPERHVYYVTLEKNNKKSFHEVYKVIKKKTSPNPFTYFYKNNTVLDSPMGELEAMCCGFYGLIAPKYVSKARVHYNANNQSVGVSSKEILNFTPMTQEGGKLKDEDLRIDILDRSGYLPYAKLDELDAYLQCSSQMIDHMEKDHVLRSIKISEVPAKHFPVTVRDLLNYRTIKGLAIGLMASYIFEEDDLHRGNIAKDGKRIDFDMSLWPLLSKFKESKWIIDGVVRRPSESAFHVRENDIRYFPNIHFEPCPLPNFLTKSPYYWPTKPSSLPDEYIASSSNAFTTRENETYKKLEKNPAFIYHKYATLLRYILTTGAMYKNIAMLHIREELTVEEKRIFDVIEQHENARIVNFKTVLTIMPEFHEFLVKHGEQVISEIKAEFMARNVNNGDKLKKLQAKADYNKKAAHVELMKAQQLDIREISAEFQRITESTIKKQQLALRSGYEEKIEAEIKSASNIQASTDYKFLMLLKYVLIPPEAMRALPKTLLAEKFPFKETGLVNIQHETVEEHRMKAALFREILMKNPSFKMYLTKFQDVLPRLITLDFGHLNESIKANGALKEAFISITAIQTDFQLLCEQTFSPRPLENSFYAAKRI